MDAVHFDLQHERRAPAPLSRMSSIASTSSDDTTISSESARRTRKRFTHEQLAMLEQLFHQCSHPTRQQREALADQAGMEIRSVTIWFQNKRQSERKVALRNSTNTTRSLSSSDNSASVSSSLKAGKAMLRPQSRVHSHSHSRASAPSRILSLDEIASRSELRIQPPSTPTRRPNPRPNATLWDSMLSSPIQSPSSPVREYHYIEFGKTKNAGNRKTLEWACAVARVSTKQQLAEGGLFATLREEPEEDTETQCSKSSAGDMDMDDDDYTDEEVHEALTPNDSFGYTEDTSKRGTLQAQQKDQNVDEDTMRAALALCGLGNR
ncbi:homeobox-domain-containing protein [Gloeophyllum trabeum ATCC 11539]|uniref:Homeobox-domain-containing protein n=1 Tax=Gloeophyllum trabeum (strain ATCC 11539 / FP-39264 / Madison 617) TaxID=670483 RepID=S7S2S9_GLOTA|nr:homeobox-domain-containing protein [Gloeophyllum trabeum ATCC 11539]EPQ60089.1 homeobox-domain-containing protein [Gloeophyllum trabeum ATCC 11539]